MDTNTSFYHYFLTSSSQYTYIDCEEMRKKRNMKKHNETCIKNRKKRKQKKKLK